jgi:hypothetical protein
VYVCDRVQKERWKRDETVCGHYRRMYDMIQKVKLNPDKVFSRQLGRYRYPAIFDGIPTMCM